MSNTSLRIAIAGVGNCASALVQGLHHYRDEPNAPGLIREIIGGWRCGDIQVVAAFDIDRRKVGHPLNEAVFAAPNCTPLFHATLPVSPVVVAMGPVLDGVAPLMADYPDDRAFRPAPIEPVDVAAELSRSGAQVLVSYMPVGSERAAQYYAEACLKAGVALVNCTPNFIASDPIWEKRFADRRLPIVGDDIKSQLGATIVHRSLAALFADRGIHVTRTYQLNVGGNTDFLNMLDRSRLASKKISKTRAVRTQLKETISDDNLHVGPSDFVPWLKDNKICHIRMEGTGFGGAPIELELRLSVVDSPNSAGVVVDAVRCAGLALQRGVGGCLLPVSAYLMKSPPEQMSDPDASRQTDAFIDL